MKDHKIYADHNFAIYQNKNGVLSFYRILGPDSYMLINKTTFNELSRLMAELSEQEIKK